MFKLLLSTDISLLRNTPQKCNAIGLSSLCIAPVFVPKVESGERASREEVVPKVELGEQRVNLSVTLSSHVLFLSLSFESPLASSILSSLCTWCPF